MATHSARCLSPPSSRVVAKTSETNSSTRRSFSGSNRAFSRPATPVVGRGFVDKECPRNYEEEKENDENMMSSRMRSPNCKNFMSATISAASKFTPSPRKKVFSERNDPIRISDGKAMIFSSSLHSECSLALDTAVSGEKRSACERFWFKPSKGVLCSDVSSDSESVITDHNSLKPELIFKTSKEVSSTIAPLDADPSLPPYAGTEILLNRGKGLDPVGFMEFENNHVAEPKGSQKDVVVPVTSGRDLPEEEAEHHVSEVPEKTSYKKTEKKYWGFSGLMCSAMFPILFLACSHSPSLGKISVKDLYQQSRIAAQKDFWLGRSHGLISFISQMAGELLKSGKPVQLQSQYRNTSDLVLRKQMKNLNNGGFPGGDESKHEAPSEEEGSSDLLQNMDNPLYQLAAIPQAHENAAESDRAVSPNAESSTPLQHNIYDAVLTFILAAAAALAAVSVISPCQGKRRSATRPSEMRSSFQKTASYLKKEQGNEVENWERGAKTPSKRESLASSSGFSADSSSPSYGSFTSFQRLPIKNVSKNPPTFQANGEVEILTPVRRSSRIRNHLISSPQ